MSSCSSARIVNDLLPQSVVLRRDDVFDECHDDNVR